MLCLLLYKVPASPLYKLTCPILHALLLQLIACLNQFSFIASFTHSLIHPCFHSSIHPSIHPSSQPAIRPSIHSLHVDHTLGLQEYFFPKEDAAAKQRQQQWVKSVTSRRKSAAVTGEAAHGGFPATSKCATPPPAPFFCHHHLTLHDCNHHMHACSSAVRCPSSADTASLQSLHACSSAVLCPCLPLTTNNCITAIITSMQAAQLFDALVCDQQLTLHHCNHHIQRSYAFVCHQPHDCGHRIHARNPAVFYAACSGLAQYPHSLKMLQANSQCLAGKSTRKCKLQLWHTHTQLRSIFVSSLYNSAQHLGNS